MTLRLLWEVEGRFSCFAVADSEAATLGSSGQLAWIAAAGAPNGEPEDGETDVEVSGEADAAFGATPGGAGEGEAPLEHRVLLFTLQSPQPVRTFALGSRASSLCFADEGHDAGSSTNGGGAATAVSEGRGRLLVLTDAAELLSVTEEPLAATKGSGSDAITDLDANAGAHPRLALVPGPAAPALPADFDLSFDAASFSSMNQNSSDIRLGLGGFMPSDSAAAAVLAAPSSDLPSVSVACEAFLSALLGERLAGTGGDRALALDLDQDQGESGSRYAAGAPGGNVIHIEEEHDDDSFSAHQAAGLKRGAYATASAGGGPIAKRRPLGLTVDTTGKMYLAAPPRAQAEAYAQAQSEAWLVALEGALVSLGPGPAERAPDVAPLAPKRKLGKEKDGGQDKTSGGASVAPNPEPVRRSTRGK